MPLSSQNIFWLRYLLSRELQHMKRPEVSDLLARAGFEARGRELFIAIPETHAASLTPVFSTALLNCGVPFDSAVLC